MGDWKMIKVTQKKVWSLALLLAISGTAKLYADDSKKSSSGIESLKLVEGDEMGNEVKALKTELLIASSEKKAIAQINKLIRKHKGTALEPELWFRLAELHMRRSKTERFFEIHRQSETVVSLAPRVVKKASAKREIRQAVNIYERIHSRFPKFHQMDLVLFNNAFARQQLGDSKGAERRYWDVVRKYKDSMLVPDAHLAVGEINFEAGRFSKALEHFNAIKKYKNSRVYPYGLYKAGWAYYNMHEARKGLQELEKVVDFGRQVAKQGLNARLDLRKEALYDMTLFYQDVYPSKGAFAYFEKQAGELEVGPYIIKMAHIYDRHSRYQDKKTVLQDFVDNRPESPSLPEVHNELVLNYENMKKRKEAVAHLEVFYDVCDPEGNWAEAQAKAQSPVKGGSKEAKAPAYLSECQETFNSTTLKLAGKWLRTWKKNPDYPQFAETAEKAFEIYLRRAGEEKKAQEARFAYAELLFQRKKYRLASEQYAMVKGGKGLVKIGHDASYAALLSLEKAVGESWSDSDEKRFRELAEVYIKDHPKGEYRLDVEFKRALIAYDKERYEEAAPVFLRLGRDYAKDEKGLRSQDLYLDILNIKKDYAGLKEYSAELIGKGADKARVVKLKKIYEESYFLQVQQMDEDGKYEEAIVEYKKFAKENKTSDLAEKAWWNAVNLHFKIWDHAGGAQAAETFYGMFPKSKQATDALLRAAQTYESMGQLESASDVLLKLAKEDKKSETKWRSLSADFALLSGLNVRSRRIFNELKDHKDRDVRIHALTQLETIAKNENKKGEHKALLEAIASSGVQPQASLAKIQLVEAIYKRKQYTEAFSEAKDVLNMGSKASAYARAKARFIQAEILEDEFIRQSVKTSASRVAMVLAIKTEKLEKAQSAFQAVMRYGDSKMSVEAMKKLASCYAHYVEALRTMPTPRGLNKEEEQMFRAEIQRLAIPLEEKSVETIAQALESAKKMDLRDGSVAELQSQLDEVNMKKDAAIDLPLSDPMMVVPTFKGVGS